MGVCYITRREQREEVSEQLGIYCAGNDARPFGEVNIPNKVMILATRVFQNDENVTKINLPPLLQEIQERAFENCIHLKEIVFPNTLQTIHEYAFNGCNELSVIAIPDNIPLLKPYAFVNAPIYIIRYRPEISFRFPKIYLQISQINSAHRSMASWAVFKGDIWKTCHIRLQTSIFTETFSFTIFL